MEPSRTDNEKTVITIKDVAQAAGVSIATVSRILNGTATVSPALAQKVQDAIQRLEYRGNAMARALKAKDTYSIGLIIPDIENPFFPALVRSVEDTAHERGNAVILCNSDGKAREEKRYIEFLYEKRVDGIIFTSGADSEPALELLHKLPVPTVILDRPATAHKMHSVASDHYQGARLASEHLLTDCGCRNIAFIGAYTKLSSAAQRYQGYLDSLQIAGIDPDPNYTLLGEFTFESGYKSMETLLNRNLPLDAVFAGSDIAAFGAIECLQAFGYKIPEDVMVIGYDDIWMAKWYKPSLTTVCQPIHEIGRSAVELLLNVRDCPDTELQEIQFTPTLVRRASTRPLDKGGTTL